MLSIWRQHHPLWLAPHRPFFALAGLSAALVPIVWLLPKSLIPEPTDWHRHELLFGSGGAAVGGYLLTALPAWTGSGPISPAATRLLVGLWLAGRLAYAGNMPSLLASAVATSYFLALGAILSYRVCKAGAWNRMPLASAPFVLCGAALAATAEYDLVHGLELARVLPLLFVLLVSLVGGSAVPAFTRHWLDGRRSGPSIADRRMSRIAITALVAGIGCEVLDARAAAGSLMILSGVLQYERMVLWKSWKSCRYPALLLLHLAWFWLPTGLVLVGLSRFTSVYPDTAAAFHSLTMGAMGTMMFAIMGRAAMMSSDGRLLVTREFALGFGLVYLSVPVRLSVPVAGPNDNLTLLLSASLWMAGWSVFVWSFRHALRGEVRRPILSARSLRASEAVS